MHGGLGICLGMLPEALALALQLCRPFSIRLIAACSLQCFRPVPPPLCAQLYEVQFDRLGAFTGVKMAMSLKGHKSKVRGPGPCRRGRAWPRRARFCCLACSPRLPPAPPCRPATPLLSSSQVFCLDFSPDLTKMVTASGDGLLKVWNINVRYHMDEDPKVGRV